jgi:hypothetical protein
MLLTMIVSLEASATPDKRPRPSILQAHADQSVIRR